jgi:hypothetical protein
MRRGFKHSAFFISHNHECVARNKEEVTGVSPWDSIITVKINIIEKALKHNAGCKMENIK